MIIKAPPISASALAPEPGSISGVCTWAEAKTQAPTQNSATTISLFTGLLLIGFQIERLSGAADIPNILTEYR